MESNKNKLTLEILQKIVSKTNEVTHSAEEETKQINGDKATHDMISRHIISVMREIKNTVGDKEYSRISDLLSQEQSNESQTNILSLIEDLNSDILQLEHQISFIAPSTQVFKDISVQDDFHIQELNSENLVFWYSKSSATLDSDIKGTQTQEQKENYASYNTSQLQTRLCILNKESEQVKDYTFEFLIHAALATSEAVYLSCEDNEVRVFDKAEFKELKKITMKADVNKITQYDNDHIICTEEEGFLEIINTKSNTIVFSKQIIENNIYRIDKTSNEGLFTIIVQGNGLSFLRITKDEKSKFQVKIDSSHFEDFEVNSAIELSSNIFAVAFYKQNAIRILDTQSGKVLETVNDPSNLAQIQYLTKIAGYDVETRPYIFVRYDSQISVFNTKTMKIFKLLNSSFSSFYNQDDLIVTDSTGENGLRVLLYEREDHTKEDRIIKVSIDQV